jgi:hypothetical protein
MAVDITRRRFFRSTLNGTAVTLALPFLDMVLNDSGTAFAATGTPIPVRFGTWHWGCGMNPERWTPETTGANWAITPELQPLAAHQADISVATGYAALLDGRANEPHISAVWALRTGRAPRTKEDIQDPSFDALIAKTMGGGVRFRSFNMAAAGGKTDTYSTTGGGSFATPDLSPLALYTRVFGPGFVDPNAATFTPDPQVMLRRSVLSSFQDERAAMMSQASIQDRAKLDEYFTSVRELEQQLSLELEKPAPAEYCEVPKAAPKETESSTEIGQVIANHKLFTDLLVMALKCHQTKVFNMVFSPSNSTLRKAGSADTHHVLTHQEPVDEKAGYQVDATWFSGQSVDALAYFVSRLKQAKEGAGSLLDNMLVYAHSDTSYAKEHALDELPVLFIGRAGGRVRTGIHVRQPGTAVTKTGLTAMHAMGVRAGSFGSQSLEVSSPISELLV